MGPCCGQVLMQKTRKRTPNRSLKRLREIVGTEGRPMTQKQFAAMVGVSLPLIKAVESGQYPVTVKLAHKIALATGAQLTWWDFRIRRGRAKVPVPNGKILWVPIGEDMDDPSPSRAKRLPHDYTRKHFDHHRRFFRTDPEAAEMAIKEVVPVIEKLFLAASKPGVAGVKHRLPTVRASFWDWVRETNRAFSLNVKS